MKKDTTIKQVIKKITKDIAKYILELKIDEDDKNIKFIDGELSRIEMREADIVAECNINNEDVILHLEIQSSYDDKMVRRMLRYYSDIKMIHSREKIYQYVIFIGKENIIPSLQSCTLLASAFDIMGHKGVIGILGPVRMNFARNILALEESYKLLYEK